MALTGRPRGHALAGSRSRTSASTRDGAATRFAATSTPRPGDEMRRILREGVAAAGRFVSRATAQRCVDIAVTRRSADIAAWLGGRDKGAPFTLRRGHGRGRRSRAHLRRGQPRRRRSHPGDRGSTGAAPQRRAARRVHARDRLPDPIPASATRDTRSDDNERHDRHRYRHRQRGDRLPRARPAARPATSTRTGARITPRRMPRCTRSRATRRRTRSRPPRTTSTVCSARGSTTSAWRGCSPTASTATTSPDANGVTAPAWLRERSRPAPPRGDPDRRPITVPAATPPPARMSATKWRSTVGTSVGIAMISATMSTGPPRSRTQIQDEKHHAGERRCCAGPTRCSTSSGRRPVSSTSGVSSTGPA